MDRLNVARPRALTPSSMWDGANGFQVNALGTDDIKVALIYQPARVKPGGADRRADLSGLCENGGDPARRTDRPLPGLQQGNGPVRGEVNHFKKQGERLRRSPTPAWPGELQRVRVGRPTSSGPGWTATPPEPATRTS